MDEIDLMNEQDIHDSAIDIAAEHLKEEGYHIVSSHNTLRRDPQLVATKDNQTFYVVVKTHIYPNNAHSMDINHMKRVEEYAQNNNAKLLYASLGLANGVDIEKPLTKSDGFYINFSGFHEISLLEKKTADNKIGKINTFSSSDLFPNNNCNYSIVDEKNNIERPESGKNATIDLIHSTTHAAVSAMLDGLIEKNKVGIRNIMIAKSEFNRVFKRNITFNELSEGHKKFKAGIKETNYWDFQEYMALASERFYFERPITTDDKFQEDLNSISLVFQKEYKKIKGNVIDVPLSPKLKKLFNAILGIESKENSITEIILNLKINFLIFFKIV